MIREFTFVAEDKLCGDCEGTIVLKMVDPTRLVSGDGFLVPTVTGEEIVDAGYEYTFEYDDVVLVNPLDLLEDCDVVPCCIGCEGEYVTEELLKAIETAIADIDFADPDLVQAVIDAVLATFVGEDTLSITMAVDNDGTISANLILVPDEPGDPNPIVITADGVTIDCAKLSEKCPDVVTTFAQDLVTGQITYTDEAGDPFTAEVVSTDADNLVVVGADGGAYLDCAAVTTCIDPEDYLSATAGNLLSYDSGYFIECADVLACIDVSDFITTDVDNLLKLGTDNLLFVEGADIMASVVIPDLLSTDGDNILTVDITGGIFLDCATVVACAASSFTFDLSADSGTDTTIAPLDEIEIIGGTLMETAISTVGSVSTIEIDITPGADDTFLQSSGGIIFWSSGTPVPTTPIALTVGDGLDSTVGGTDNHTVTLDLVVDPNPTNAISNSATGLYSLLVFPKADVTNAITVDSSGWYVPTFTNTALTVVDTNSINLTANGTDSHTLQADVRIDPAITNAITVSASGIHAPIVTVTAADTNSIDMSVTANAVSGALKLSPTVSNIPNDLIVNGSGAYVPRTDFGFVQTGGTGAAYTLTNVAIPAYYNNLRVAFRAHAGCSNDATMNLNGFGPRQLITVSGINIRQGEVRDGFLYEAIYDTGYNAWRVLNPFSGTRNFSTAANPYPPHRVESGAFLTVGGAQMNWSFVGDLVFFNYLAQNYTNNTASAVLGVYLPYGAGASPLNRASFSVSLYHNAVWKDAEAHMEGENRIRIRKTDGSNFANTITDLWIQMNGFYYWR